jgi:2-polyprenyl-3-methyl-5-hydroxy-6-metoxy-1,4-benzoquinol methylase
VGMLNKTNAQDMNSDWPADGFEAVPNCPVCSDANRELLHGDLTDQIFFCAPGTWSMYGCESCGSAYLDPRPSPATIGLAYQRYFTHDQATGYSALRFLEKIRRRFANGYRNYHYGTRDYPASILGIIAANLMPNGRAVIDAGMRHLPKAKAGMRLLDLGCGSGEFLLRARSAGWAVVGVDFDAKAAETARRQGLDVRLGGVEELNPVDEQFDVITLAHVIEHVHYPVEVLQACYKLLKPGGFLWLETPNIASEGHRLFNAAWRGLEPPRHLVLFNLESMGNALSTAGFSEVKVQSYRPLCDGVFRASQAIADGIDPYSELGRNGSVGMAKKAERLARIKPEYREFITVKAWKK